MVYLSDLCYLDTADGKRTLTLPTMYKVQGTGQHIVYTAVVVGELMDPLLQVQNRATNKCFNDCGRGCLAVVGNKRADGYISDELALRVLGWM